MLQSFMVSLDFMRGAGPSDPQKKKPKQDKYSYSTLDCTMIFSPLCCLCSHAQTLWRAITVCVRLCGLHSPLYLC